MSESIAFGAANYAVLVVYLAIVVGIGLLVSGKQKTTTDFFLAGRNVPWFIVAMSVFATITSAVTYMGVPGLVYGENLSIMVGILMMPAVAPFIILLFLPFYQRLNVTTSYEYILQRFGANARYCVSGLFVCARLGWLGTVIYAPALALSVVTGMDLWLAIVLMGLLATAYTAIGGLAAVIWTDAAQFVILVCGALLVAASLMREVPGGVPEILRVAGETGHLNLLEWKPSLTHMTVTVVAVSYFFNFLHDYGVDQITVQRLLATRSLGAMARATVVNALMSVAIVGVLAFIGLGLFAYHQAWPDRLPDGIVGDQVFPYYIVHALPAGVSGLVIAGIFAAAMSSMDSGINSLSTVVVNDFIRPARGSGDDDKKDLWIARVLVVVFGVFATGVAFFATTIGEILKTAQVFLGLFSGPVLALFLLGILTRRGSFAAWLFGVAVAVPATIALQRLTDVHFVYYFPFSFGLCFLVGVMLSFVFKAPAADPSLTIRGSVVAKRHDSM